MTLDTIALGVVLPACIVGVTMLVAGWLRARFSSLKDARWAGASIGVGFIVSFYVIDGWHGLWPPDEWHQLLPLAGLMTVVALIGSFIAATWQVRLIIAVAMGCLTSAIIGFPGFSSIGWRVGLGCAVALSAFSAASIARRSPSSIHSIVLAVIFFALSGVVLESDFLQLTIPSIALGAMCIALFVAGLLVRLPGVPDAGAMILGGLLPVLALSGPAYTYSDVPPISWILVAAAPLLLWIGAWKPIAQRAPWVRRIAQVCVVLAPCVIAVALAISATESESDADDSAPTIDYDF